MFRVNGVDELPDDLAGTVGVTAGASAPEELVEAVIARLAPRHGVEEVAVTDEEVFVCLVNLFFARAVERACVLGV